MKVHLELYASLMCHLPPGSQRHRTTVEVQEPPTVLGLLGRFGVPPQEAHLVVVNGLFVHPDQRATRPLSDGDVVAVWPPVAGG